MTGRASTKDHQVATQKRVLNEFSSKILNEERLDKVTESRKTSRLSPHADMAFHCECDDQACTETIMMSTEEYQQVHHKTKQFVVVPAHVRLDIEEIITAFNNYVLVAKFFPRQIRS